MRKLRRAVIKEEMVALVGDATKAVILNQLIFCQERTRDVDRFIQEERERCQKSGTTEPMQLMRGWFYKSASELAVETMLGLSPSNMRRHLSELIERGWLLERHNPYHKWDRTKQYRVDLTRVKGDLERIGYTLEGWTSLPSPIMEDASSKTENGSSDMNNRPSLSEDPSSDSEARTPPIGRAIPETTTKTLSESIAKKSPPIPPAQPDVPNGGEEMKVRKEDGRTKEPSVQPRGAVVTGFDTDRKSGIDESAALGLIDQYLTGSS